MRTEQGANLGGTGTSTVEVRAVEDGKIYFAFRWEDPDALADAAAPAQGEDGWHMLGTKADIADVADYYEDKIAILFTRSDAFGNGGIDPYGPRSRCRASPSRVHGRGYHYTTDGLYADVWQWKASRGGLLGRVDDMCFGPPNEANEAMKAGKARYQAGYDSDPGTGFYVYNYKTEAPGGYRGPVTLRKLPEGLCGDHHGDGDAPPRSSTRATTRARAGG